MTDDGDRPPRTTSGKALSDGASGIYLTIEGVVALRAAIVAIESEARADERERIAAWWRVLQRRGFRTTPEAIVANRMGDDWPSSDDTDWLAVQQELTDGYKS